jgi:pantothenate synthetase
MIEEFDGFKVQYFELVDSYTLQPISRWESHRDQRACIAVLTSKTRLIDNIAL